MVLKQIPTQFYALNSQSLKNIDLPGKPIATWSNFQPFVEGFGDGRDFREYKSYTRYLYQNSYNADLFGTRGSAI